MTKSYLKNLQNNDRISSDLEVVMCGSYYKGPLYNL